jgi:hypothetical protein
MQARDRSFQMRVKAALSISGRARWLSAPGVERRAGPARPTLHFGAAFPSPRSVLQLPQKTLLQEAVEVDLK